MIMKEQAEKLAPLQTIPVIENEITTPYDEDVGLEDVAYFMEKLARAFEAAYEAGLKAELKLEPRLIEIDHEDVPRSVNIPVFIF